MSEKDPLDKGPVANAEEVLQMAKKDVLIGPEGYQKIIKDLLPLAKANEPSEKIVYRERPTHAQLVAALSKPGEAILQQMTPFKAELEHMAIGVSGEAGELLDAVKRHTIYGKELDRVNVIEEIGDTLFYLRRLMQMLEITQEGAEQANIDKLLKRYEGMKYSDKAAQERADKA